MTGAEPRAEVRRPLVVALAVGLGTVGILVLLAIAQQLADRPTAEPTPEVTSPVDGVIVAVDSAGLADVRGFTLRPSGSPFSFGFTLGTLENPTDFPPGHLAEHLASSEPVRVFFRTENGVHTVYRLEDAAPVSPAPS